MENKNIMKYFPLILVTAFALPLFASAITNCDDQAVPAMDCPPGFSRTCSNSGGTYHWSCGKAAGAIATPTSGTGAAHVYQHNQTDLEFIRTRDMQGAQTNPMYEDKDTSGVNPIHEGRIAMPPNAHASTTANAWGRVKVRFPWLERFFGGGADSNGLGLGKTVNDYAVDTATGTSTNRGPLISAMHKLFGALGLGRFFNNKWDGTEDMTGN